MMADRKIDSALDKAASSARIRDMHGLFSDGVAALRVLSFRARHLGFDAAAASLDAIASGLDETGAGHIADLERRMMDDTEVSDGPKKV